MLRDGEFIKEPPVRISAYYMPPLKNDATPEEFFIQHVLLENKPRQHKVIRSVTKFVSSILKEFKK